jgi:hypothetical protein
MNTGKAEWQPELPLSLNQTVKGEITMFYICDKFGFISGFEKRANYEGEVVLKALHCMDIREAKSFSNRGEAERAYRKLGIDWWHCVLSSNEQEEMAAS